MNGGRYRNLRPGENPDRSKGDQFQDAGNGFWILAYPEHDGTRPSAGGRWRRPINPKPSDLHESTCGR